MIYVDPRKLNDAFVHDPFLKSFTYEVLDNVRGKEAYSFTNEFYGYHQIAQEDRSKTTFVIEWVCFQYIVMSLRLNNVLVIFSCIVIEVFKDFIHKFLEVYFNDKTMLG